MRALLLLPVLAIVVGCGKPAPTTQAKPEPSDAAFDEASPDNTLLWLAAQKKSLHGLEEQEASEKFKAIAETMKGRSLNWPGELAETNANKTYGLYAFTHATPPPGPQGEEAREWHFTIVCKPLEQGVQIVDDAPFVRKPDLGFPSGAGDWHAKAKRNIPVRLTGTIGIVQLHRRSWVTGYGIKDRVVHSETGITLHLTDGAVSPAP